ncbi:hypothetical protein B0J14DRAFT_563739 [Halenospora varia]|nr:hypothetical protein B0J14DRAFT_563739 [Halenospora varia]
MTSTIPRNPFFFFASFESLATLEHHRSERMRRLSANWRGPDQGFSRSTQDESFATEAMTMPGGRGIWRQSLPMCECPLYSLALYDFFVANVSVKLRACDTQLPKYLIGLRSHFYLLIDDRILLLVRNIQPTSIGIPVGIGVVVGKCLMEKEIIFKSTRTNNLRSKAPPRSVERPRATHPPECIEHNGGFVIVEGWRCMVESAQKAGIFVATPYRTSPDQLASYYSIQYVGRNGGYFCRPGKTVCVIHNG